MPSPRRTVFISSTAIDLPEHRAKVVQACLEADFFPDGMERWPAADATALDLCIEKVDAAEVFVGIYAHRYGWVPPGQTKSITELEYERAGERKIPRLLFVMGEDHPIRAKDKDNDAGPINAFRQRIETDRVRATFDNADHLRAEVLHALKEAAPPPDTGTPPPAAPTTPATHFNNLPLGGTHLFGRTQELAGLDAAWADAGHTRIVTLVAPGGTGKTALVRDWLLALSHDDWRGARRVYGWSFYSQGTSDDRQASEDGFLAAALDWFGIAIPASTEAGEKGRHLAAALRAQRSLLLLDGIEPLQYPPSSAAAGLAGQLRAPGLQALLLELAQQPGQSLCVVTSREHLADLAGFLRQPERLAGSVLAVDLGNLSDADGAKLLHAEGATRAGDTAITADDAELVAASREVKGHALTLTLLSQYLKRAHGGDIRHRDQVDFAKADQKAGGHAFRVIAATERWLEDNGGQSAQELAALRLLGFFDRPATKDNLAALRAAPAIAGLTEALQGMDEADWRMALSTLADCGLVEPGADGSLDAHPLVREYFAAALEKKQPDAWREGHRRLYEQLKASAPHRPEGLTGLQPLYQAVVHGCKAGLYQEACDEVYRDRILRGTGEDGFYSIRKLGAIGADLGALACFFVEPWRRPAPTFKESGQAWLHNEAAYRLRALGRLVEALEPMQAGAEMRVKQKDWRNSSISYGNLSELLLNLGRVAAAEAEAEQALAYANQSGDAFECMGNLTTIADARHQQGKAAAALADFAAAESIQAVQQPHYPLIYSLQGFRYCDLLLGTAERAAWLGDPDAALAATCDEVEQRTAQTLVWAEANGALPLEVGLDHLTIARCVLYADRLHGRTPADTAEVEAAIAGLRQAGNQVYLPRALLTRAWLRHCRGDTAGGAADLDEAHRIAARGGMKLHLADIALTRARLFRDRTELAKARALIEECGYGRRIGELEDAEARAAAEGWPQ